MKGRGLDLVLGQMQKLFHELVSTWVMWWHLLAFVLRRAPGSEFGISGTGRAANTGAGKVNLSIHSLGPVKDSDRQLSVSLRAQVRN